MNRFVYPDLGLAERIRNERLKRDMNQSELAKLCDVDRKSVVAWEGGIRSPKAHHLKMICLTFRCSADYLLGVERR